MRSPLFILGLLLGLAVCFQGTAQLDQLKKIKKATDQVKNIKNVNDIVDIAKDKYVEYLKKHKDDFDKTDLNYAVSFSDNSGMYETEEKFSRMQKTLLYILDPTSLSDRTAKEQAADYNDAGELFYATGKFNLAEEMFNEAMLSYQTAGMQDSVQYSQVLSNLGLLYNTTGRYNLSEQYTLQAMEQRKKNPSDKKGMAASMNNLAVLYQDEGKYTESDDAITQAQQLARESEGSHSTAYAITLNNQAILYQLTGKYDDAGQLLKQALSLAGEELGKKSPNYIRMKINLALLYQLQERYDEAEKIFLDAIDIKKRRLGTSHPDYAVLLQDLASLYQIKGSYTKAEGLLKQALDIYKKKFGEQHPSVASALYDLARLYQYQGKIDAALPLLNKALKIQTDNLGEHHPATASTLESLAILYWQKGDMTTAAERYKKVMEEYMGEIKNYFPAMSEYDKTRFWDKIGPKFIRFNSFAVDAAGTIPDITTQMYDERMATKAILLSATTRVKYLILNGNDKALKEKYSQWLDMKEYISRLYSKSKEELRNDRINLDSLENVANAMEKDLSRQSELFASSYSTKQASWKNLAAVLSPQEACVELIRFKKYRGLVADTAVWYAALVVKNNNKPPVLVPFPNGNDLEGPVVAAYREAMQSSAPEAPFRPQFWKGIDEATEGATHIFASLDGAYNQINLNTLQTPGGKYLIDEKNITYITNTRDVIDLKQRQIKNPSGFGNKSAILIGNPHYALGLSWNDVKQTPLPELPGTAVEIQKIQQQLKSQNWKITSYQYDDATEKNLRSVSGPSILHIATHGFFLEDLPESQEKVFGIEPLKAARNPLLRSGLMLAGADNTIQQIGKQRESGDNDGILNAYEASLLNLDQTELVVLSACETGLGETKNGEGVYGLQRAFEIAGARTLIISLWEVSDEVTQQLMSSFYKYWLQLKDKHKAFEKAQLDVKSLHPEPFYWGAFIMMGE